MIRIKGTYQKEKVVDIFLRQRSPESGVEVVAVNPDMPESESILFTIQQNGTAYRHPYVSSQLLGFETDKQDRVLVIDKP